MASNYEQVAENGITFVFKRDEVEPTLLHIFARHLTTIEDALDVFFETKPTYNLKRERYENYSKTHGLYWFWIDRENRIVMVISCFRL